MTQKDTKERILDVAEWYFAAQGYHGASLRAITSEAGVNLAAVNYHFGSKEGLVRAVIERRILPLNKIRQDRLTRIREEASVRGKRPDTDAVLRAFIEPTILFRETDPDATGFITIVHRSIAEPDNTVRQIFLGLIEPVIKLFIEVMREALPGLPAEIVRRRIFFVIAIVSHALMRIGCQEAENGGEPSCGGSILDMIMPFVKAGMEAPQ
jgi:AcrR family transcriptional regulator